ncbi:MAG: hypothetical protein KDD36_13150 [Flavobacteriales bacterium]|nr:hypothetical protein [Flavobacteriales bacterium]
MASEQTTYDDYDRINYSVTGSANEGEKQNYSQLNIRGGIGYDLSLGFGNVFGEAMLIVPATTFNSQTGADFEIPVYASLNAGVRIPIGR